LLSSYKNIQFIPHTEHHVNTVFSVKYDHNRQIRNGNHYWKSCHASATTWINIL